GTVSGMRKTYSSAVMVIRLGASGRLPPPSVSMARAAAATTSTAATYGPAVRMRARRVDMQEPPSRGKEWLDRVPGTRRPGSPETTGAAAGEFEPRGTRDRGDAGGRGAQRTLLSHFERSSR